MLMPSRVKKMPNILKEVEKYEKSNVRQQRSNTKFHSPVISYMTVLYHSSMSLARCLKQDYSTFNIITIRSEHYQFLHVLQITFTETCQMPDFYYFHRELLLFSEFFKTLKLVKYKCIFFIAIFVEKQHLSAENRYNIEIYR